MGFAFEEYPTIEEKSEKSKEKKKKKSDHFKNMISVPKTKAWEWKSKEHGMFGELMFE